MNGRDGYSLLEVLVALVVFAIGVTGLLVALGNNLRDINFAKDHARAVRIATREMDALRRSTYIPEPSNGEEGRFSWSSEIMAIDLADLPGMDSDDAGRTDANAPCQMEVVVAWSDDAGGELNHKVAMNGIELFRNQ